MTWNPINCKTHFSLQHGFCKPDKLAKKCADYGYESCGIADFGTLSGAVDFHQSCTKHGIKPIIGCEFDGYILYAKNKNGWFDLVKYVSNQTLDVLKEVAKNGNVLCVTPSVNGFANLFKSNHIQLEYQNEAIYYVEKDDADCHRIMLCGKLKTTLKKVKSLEVNEYSQFFDGNDRWYLPSADESINRSKNIAKIVDACEAYELAGPPMLPAFECPNGYDEDQYLTELCRVGWKNKLIPHNKVSTEEQKSIYAERVKHELKVIFKAKLSGYFLIVQDIIKWVKSKGWLAGPGRGCFLPDTRVKMANGLMKSISDVEIGDEVVDCYGDVQEVYDTLTYDIDEEIIELEFENKKIIRCTLDHKFLTNNRGWVEAQNLKEEDDIVEI